MSEKSHVVQDTDCQIQSWSEAIEIIEMLLDDLQIIKTSSEKLYDDIQKLDKPATKSEEEKILKLSKKYKESIFSIEIKLASTLCRSLRK